MEVEELAGVSDIDRRTVNDPDAIRTRICACGNLMSIKVGLDAQGNPTEITCVQGTYLREGGRDFAMGDLDYRQLRRMWAKFIYCKSCRSRRAWNSFKEQVNAA